jgi:cell division protein FtsL
MEAGNAKPHPFTLTASAKRESAWSRLPREEVAEAQTNKADEAAREQLPVLFS